MATVLKIVQAEDEIFYWLDSGPIIGGDRYSRGVRTNVFVRRVL